MGEVRLEHGGEEVGEGRSGYESEHCSDNFENPGPYILHFVLYSN